MVIGFMLLAGRLRTSSEEQFIIEVIKRHFNRYVDPHVLFGISGGSGGLASCGSLQLLRQPLPNDFKHIVWTPELLRMGVLVHKALTFDEPCLLVGNTG